MHRLQSISYSLQAICLVLESLTPFAIHFGEMNKFRQIRSRVNLEKLQRGGVHLPGYGFQVCPGLLTPV